MEPKHHIGFELRTTANIIRREIDNAMMSHKFEKLTGMQGRVIGYLCRNIKEQIFQKDIENEFSIRRSTATNMLQTMEKHGLIKRHSVSYDARLKQLIPTEKAITRHNVFEQEIEKVENKVLDGITEQERKTLFAILNKIKSNLGEQAK